MGDTSRVNRCRRAMALGLILLAAACKPEPGEKAEAAQQRALIAPPSPETPAEARPAPRIDDAYVKSSSMKLCTEKWPDNLALRAACRRNADEGVASYREIAARYAEVPDMQRALGRCLDKHTEGDATNFALVGGCARNNEEGLRELAQ